MKLSGKKMIRRLLLAAAPLVLFTIGCSFQNSAFGTEIRQEDLPGGRRSHTRTDVPHTVESTEISSFFIYFGFRDPYMPERSGPYSYALDKENGTWKLKSKKETIDVTQENVDAIERMIRRFDIASLNGISEHTNGLPFLGNEFSFLISYASGESISASSNCMYPIKWAMFRMPFKRYMDELFIAAGHTEYAYPPKVFRISSFSLDIRQPEETGVLKRTISLSNKQIGGNYTLQEIAEERIDPNDFSPYLFDVAYLWHEDGTDETVHERSIPWSPEIAASLQELLARYSLDFEDGSRVTEEDERTAAYCVRIYYESGRSSWHAAKGKTPTPQEIDLENAFIEWTERIFAEHRDEIETE